MVGGVGDGPLEVNCTAEPTVGKPLYLSATAGKATSTAPAIPKLLGVCIGKALKGGVWKASIIFDSANIEGALPSVTRYDDQQGTVISQVTGASQWTVAQIGTSGFLIPWLAAGQNDYFQSVLQFSHRKILNTPLESFHIHYVLSTVPVAGRTIKLNYSYVWINHGGTVPTAASWTSGTYTYTASGSELASTMYIASILNNIPPPANETYSSMFMIKISRQSQGTGSDTYVGDFGLLYTDGHFQTNHAGSVGPFSD